MVYSRVRVERHSKGVWNAGWFCILMSSIYIINVLSNFTVIPDLYIYRRYIYFILVICVFFRVLIENRKTDKLITCVMLFTAYAIIVSVINNISNYEYSSMLYFGLCFCIPYLNMRSHDINIVYEQIKIAACWTYIIIGGIYVILCLQNGLTNALLSHTAYMIPALLPFLFSIRSKKMATLLIASGFMIVVLTLKRGAFIAFTCGVAVYVITYLFSKSVSIKRKISVLLITIFSVIVIIAAFDWIVAYTDLNIIVRLANIAQDGGSSRNSIFKAVWYSFHNNGQLEQLFGKGFNGVRADYVFYDPRTTYSAHNDFLEIMYDFGWVGLSAYSAIIYCIMIINRKLYRQHDPIARVISVSIVTFIVQSMVSHMILYNYFYHWWIVLWVMGLLKYKQNKNPNESKR